MVNMCTRATASTRNNAAHNICKFSQGSKMDDYHILSPQICSQLIPPNKQLNF